MLGRYMCSFKTQIGFALPYWYRWTYFHSLSSARRSTRKNTRAVCWCIPSQGFCLLPLAVDKHTWGNAAVGMESAKQQRWQAEVWVVGLFCLSLSNSLLEFCQLNNRALLSTLMEARLEKKVSGPMATRLLNNESGNMTPSVMSAQTVTCAVFLAAQWLNRANTDLHYYCKAWAQEKKKK